MAPKVYFVNAILMLLLNLVPYLTQSKPIDSPFGFLSNLEGSMKGQNVDGLHQLKRYLVQFGYLENRAVSKHSSMTIDENDNLFDEKLEKAIKTYQPNYKLDVTGHLDGATVTQMMKPRCGCPDIMNGRNTMIRNKHKTIRYKIRKSINGTFLYVLWNTKWPPSQYNLTYKTLTNTLVAGTENMRAIVDESLIQWVQYTPFTFEEVTDGSNTNLVFQFSNDRGDRTRFDGPGGILALSMFSTGGQSRYDANENWSDDPGQDQFDLYFVVLHEIGNLLGLAHSLDSSAVMYAMIAAGKKKRELQSDDIQGIEAIYKS